MKPPEALLGSDASHPALETSLRRSVSRDRLGRSLDHFSQLVRHSGSEDEWRAASGIVSELRDLGIAAEILECDAFISMPLESNLIVTDAAGESVFSCPVRTRAFSSQTPAAGIEADLVFVPVATPAPGEMIFSHRAAAGEYTDRTVIGKIVLTADGGPDGILRAQERGAAGHIHIWPSDEGVVHEMIASSVWGTPTPSSARSLPIIPVLGLTLHDGAEIVRLLKTTPLRARLTTRVETGWARLPVAVATIPGVGSEDFLLVGSHIDSWYEGVTDNATGDVALLEMARILADHASELHFGVQFAWWPGHSTGRYAGSTWYADTRFRDLRDHGLAYLNIDSPGVRDATIWDCRYNTAEVEHLTAAVVHQLSGQTPRLHRPVRAADQSFLGIGLPSLGAYRMLPPGHPDRKTVGGCGGAYWWHSPEDTRDKADVDVLAGDIEVYVTLVARFCATERLPFTFVSTAHDFIDQLTILQHAGEDHLDLSPTLAAAEAFRAAAADLARSPDADAKTTNERLKQISRTVNPVLYTVHGPFEMDPALQLPLLPGLARMTDLDALDPGSNDYRFLVTMLRRQQNRIEDALLTAVELARGGVR